MIGHLYPISFRQLGTHCAMNEQVPGALILVNPLSPICEFCPLAETCGDDLFTHGKNVRRKGRL